MFKEPFCHPRVGESSRKIFLPPSQLTFLKTWATYHGIKANFFYERRGPGDFSGNQSWLEWMLSPRNTVKMQAVAKVISHGNNGRGQDKGPASMVMGD